MIGRNLRAGVYSRGRQLGV